MTSLQQWYKTGDPIQPSEDNARLAFLVQFHVLFPSYEFEGGLNNVESYRAFCLQRR